MVSELPALFRGSPGRSAGRLGIGHGLAGLATDGVDLVAIRIGDLMYLRNDAGRNPETRKRDKTGFPQRFGADRAFDWTGWAFHDGFFQGWNGDTGPQYDGPVSGQRSGWVKMEARK